MLFVILLFYFLFVLDSVIKFKHILISQTKINWLRTSPKRLEGLTQKWKPCKNGKKLEALQNESFSVTSKSLKSFSKDPVTVSCSVPKLDMFLDGFHVFITII